MSTAHRTTPAFWRKQRVILTGGGGFLGSFVYDQLKTLEVGELAVPRSRDCDLRDLPTIQRLLKEVNPTMIIHLAAVCGGIGINRISAGQFFYDNAVMGIQLMEAARQWGVKKFVQIGTVCAYPKFTKTPFKESSLWDGYPEETNAPYGLAKKMLLVQSQAYRDQYGFNGIYLLPANLYGPRDHFDLEKSHVIPALIRKFEDAREAGKHLIEVWGTGKPTREFLYVEDAARGVLLAAQHYNSPEPLNLGTGREVRIRDLVTLVQRLSNFQGKIVWNRTRPDGQPRRSLDTRAAQKAFGFKATMPLEEGLKKTIEWYRSAPAAQRQ